MLLPMVVFFFCYLEIKNTFIKKRTTNKQNPKQPDCSSARFAICVLLCTCIGNGSIHPEPPALVWVDI